jgi:hypothetical protein
MSHEEVTKLQIVIERVVQEMDKPKRLTALDETNVHVAICLAFLELKRLENEDARS